MISKRVLLAALLVCALGWTGYAHALPVISIIPEVAGGFQPGVTPPTPIPGFDHTQNQAGPAIVRVNFLMEITGLAGAPDEVGFSNAAWNINLLGDVARATTPFPANYSSNNPRVDHDGDGGLFTDEVNTFEFNTDDGPNKTDLKELLTQSVTAGFGPEGVDPRLRTGQDGPFLIGSVFVLWDGDGTSGDFVSAELLDPIGSYFDSEGVSFSLPASQGVDGQVQLGVVPEPGAFVLMGVGVTALLALRRRRS